MARMLPVNDALLAEVERLSAGDAASREWLLNKVKGALAVSPGDDLSDVEDYPVLGFHIASTPQLFTAHFVTPGRFIRFEFVEDRSMIITVSLDRVARIVEEWAPGGVGVTVEIDADRKTGVVDVALGGDGAAGTARGTVTFTPTGYSVTAGEDEDGAGTARLSEFSTALRSAIGL